MGRILPRWFHPVAGVLALAAAEGVAAPEPPGDRLVAAGQRLYREGRSLSGEPVSAVVQGDVPVAGTQVTCESCHGRSGMGTIEGGQIPAALAGPLLFAPDPQRQRPAYTARTLARALREGIDSAGRPLDPLMPRYRLGDEDMAGLTAYLGRLGTLPSPGIGPTSIEVATLIAGDVPADREAAVLEVLDAFVADRNQSGPRRLRGGHVPGQTKEVYHRWSLDVWRVTGPPSGWRAQLEKRYRERPVFAIVSGLAGGSWEPVHEFCESKELICLLPNVDPPVAAGDFYYSLYFSRGMALEAEILAAELLGSGKSADVVQVVPGGDPAAGVAAEVLARTLERGGGRSSLRVLENGPGRVAALAGAISGPASAVVVWLPRAAVRELPAPPAAGEPAPTLLFSSTLLESDWEAVPSDLRARSLVAHLFRLPGEPDPPLERFRAWTSGRGIGVRHERLQAQTFFACMAVAEGLKHFWRFPTRDYFMDLLSHAANLASYAPLYPRPGFSPGQRMLARGGYLVDLSGRREPTWRVP